MCGMGSTEYLRPDLGRDVRDGETGQERISDS